MDSNRSDNHRFYKWLFKTIWELKATNFFLKCPYIHVRKAKSSTVVLVSGVGCVCVCVGGGGGISNEA